MKNRIGTIISRDHAPAARVLARSLARNHPELQLEVLVVDHEFYPADLSEEPFARARWRRLSIAEASILPMSASR